MRKGVVGGKKIKFPRYFLDEVVSMTSFMRLVPPNLPDKYNLIL